MRPRNLHIEGFTCFADAVDIDFTDMDVFVITGPTGAGKSTIIDAMCYALYGRVPRHAETQQLMSHNRDNLRVAFEFSVTGQIYRVVRTINLTRKTARDGKEKTTRVQSPVQLEQLIDSLWQPMAGRVKGLDDEISRIVGLDFVAFQRCVVLPQGRFQEFLAGEKGDRRNVLKDLLDVGVYEQIMTAANQRAKERATSADNIDRRLREDYADATPEELDACRVQLAKVTPALDRERRKREQLTEARNLSEVAINAQLRERERLEQHARAEEELDSLKKLGSEGQLRLGELRGSLERIENDRHELAYDPSLHQELGVARERARQLEDEASELGEARAAAAVSPSIDEMQAALEFAAAAYEQAEEGRAAAGDRLEAERRADVAAHVRSGLKPGDDCPVCGGVVGKIPKVAADGLETSEKAVQQAELVKDQAQRARQKAEVALHGAREAMKAAVDRIALLESNIVKHQTELEKVLPTTVEPKPEAIQAALAGQDAAAALATALDKEVANLRAELTDLEPQVAESGKKLAGTQAKAALLREEATASRKDRDEAIVKLRALADEGSWIDILKLIASESDSRPAIRAALSEASRKADELMRTKTQIETRGKDIEKKIEKAGELRAELTALREESALFKELGNLLRADAFQEFVIRSAMVVLAESATDHLKSLHPRFAMAVSSGEFEVIDHWQADQARSAKTLSGGETFVVSLALALALAERLPELRSAAAARLESLFLDEGFGTLDPETLETVINALDGLRSEDRMVGIVTHVPELAQRIERCITVRKSPSGSTIDVG